MVRPLIIIVIIVPIIRRIICPEIRDAESLFTKLTAGEGRKPGEILLLLCTYDLNSNLGFLNKGRDGGKSRVVG